VSWRCLFCLLKLINYKGQKIIKVVTAAYTNSSRHSIAAGAIRLNSFHVIDTADHTYRTSAHRKTITDDILVFIFYASSRSIDTTYSMTHCS